MHRLIDHLGMTAGFSRRQFSAAALAAATIALVLPATASAATQTLTVEKGGTGTGTVVSSPAGINCGGTCSFAFTEGAAVTLAGSAGPNAAAVQWSGCEAVTAENKCKVTMSAAKAVKATFDIVQRELKVTKAGEGTGTVTSSPAGIDCGAACKATYAHGTIVTLSAVPGPGTLPVSWSGCFKVTAENKCEVTMTGARSVTATFDLGIPLNVSKVGPGSGTVTSVPVGIECGATCTAAFDQGATVTLASVSGPNSEDVQWTGCDTVTGENKCEVEMSAARSVTAAYAPKPGASIYTVSVEKKGTGSGAVTSSPGGIECGSACSVEVVAKTKIMLVATPAPGSVFAHWSGGGCTGSGACEKPIISNRTVKAVFTAIDTRTLTISIVGSGTVKSKAAGIECSASCSPELTTGTKVTLRASAATGSKFSGWSGACTGIAPCKVQLAEAQSVTATFTKPPAQPATATATVANRARVKGGKAFLAVRCNGPASCRGSLRLLARLGGKSTAIGSAGFSLAPGSATTLKVRLSTRAQRVLKSAGKLKARVSGSGIEAHAVRLRG
ncbi:MAG: InlB B-repeat-containing protein [Solirubrobacterales bacterium]